MPLSKGGNADFEYISSWYLSEILLINGENINFNYTELNTNSWSNGAISVKRAEEFGYNQCGYDNERFQSYNLQYSKSSSMNRIECYLNSILWNEGSVNFSYSNRGDIDTQVSSSQKLDNISIKKLNGTLLYNSDGTEISNTKFNYSYFNNQDYNEINKFFSLRLKLDSLSIDDKKYSFNYMNPNSLPKKYSNSIDHWGYFNDKANLSNVTQNDINGTAYKVPYFIPEMVVFEPTVFSQPKFYEGANRESNSTVLSNGLLSSIQYPTKGLVSFEYEPHDFELNLNVNTTSVGLLSYSDKFEDNTIAVINKAIVSYLSGYPGPSPNPTFTLTKTTKVALEFEYFPGGQQHLPISTAGVFGSIERIDGGSTFLKTFPYVIGTISKKYNEEIELVPGTYRIATSNTYYYTTQGSAKYTIEKELPPSKKVIGGGVRIKKIIEVFIYLLIIMS